LLIKDSSAFKLLESRSSVDSFSLTPKDGLVIGAPAPPSGRTPLHDNPCLFSFRASFRSYNAQAPKWHRPQRPFSWTLFLFLLFFLQPRFCAGHPSPPRDLFLSPDAPPQLGGFSRPTTEHDGFKVFHFSFFSVSGTVLHFSFLFFSIIFVVVFFEGVSMPTLRPSRSFLYEQWTILAWNRLFFFCWDVHSPQTKPAITFFARVIVVL